MNDRPRNPRQENVPSMRTTVPHPLRARLLEVVSTENFGIRMQRVTLGGAQLEEDFPLVPMAPDDHVKLMFPDPTTGVISLPEIVDGRPMRRQDSAPLMRDYTVRSFNSSGLVIDFLRHEHGPAGRWATTARTGDPLGVVGPRGSRVYPNTFNRYVLVADETGLPAVARWLEESTLPAEIQVYVFGEGSDEYPLPERRKTHIHWLNHRLGPERTDILHELGESLELSDDLFIWATGESESLSALRQGLRDRGFPHENRHFSGYWRAGVAGARSRNDDDD